MSGFLNNLAAKGRGVVPRLQPRRPAPYEGQADGPGPAGLEPMPQTSANLTSSAVPEPAASFAAKPAPPSVVIPASPQRPASAATTPADVSATAVSTPGVARRMAATPADTPSPLAPTSPPAPLSGPSTKAAPASAGVAQSAAIARAESSDSSVHPHDATHRTLLDSSQTAAAPKPQERVPTPAERSEAGTPPLLQAERQSPWSAAQGPAQNQGDAAPAPETAVVEVHIGTIEVVATQPPAPMPQHHAAPSRGTSLDDFLDGTGRK